MRIAVAVKEDLHAGGGVLKYGVMLVFDLIIAFTAPHKLRARNISSENN